jgi:hypothetical protein
LSIKFIKGTLNLQMLKNSECVGRVERRPKLLAKDYAQEIECGARGECGHDKILKPLFIYLYLFLGLF